MSGTNSKLAVFIDCENADPNLAPAFFAHWSHLAKAIIKRGYGDVARLQGWSEVLKEHCYQPILTPHSPKPANATDFALVIDCLELLHTRRFDEAWLVTSDADFAQLAVHLRTYGVQVIGVGETKTLVAFRKACNKFLDYRVKSKPTAEKKPNGGAIHPGANLQ